MVRKPKGSALIQRCEDSLNAAKKMREAGAIDPFEAHFLVSRAITEIVEYRVFVERSSPALNELAESPDDIAEGDAEFERVLDETTAATFEEYDEPALARMFRNDRDLFDRQCDEGERRHAARTASVKN